MSVSNAEIPTQNGWNKENYELLMLKFDTIAKTEGPGAALMFFMMDIMENEHSGWAGQSIHNLEKEAKYRKAYSAYLSVVNENQEIFNATRALPPYPYMPPWVAYNPKKYPKEYQKIENEISAWNKDPSVVKLSDQAFALYQKVGQLDKEYGNILPEQVKKTLKEYLPNNDIIDLGTWNLDWQKADNPPTGKNFDPIHSGPPGDHGASVKAVEFNFSILTQTLNGQNASVGAEIKYYSQKLNTVSSMAHSFFTDYINFFKNINQAMKSA